ncbi:MAG: hypothetical protein LBK61_08605 [Spirochaetaceae bacterium]|jgi:hypothetical protein|nr:hypothetical protein [Spirochaetaceae bacterium]
MAGNGEPEETAGENVKDLALGEAQSNGRVLTQMLNAFIRGKDPGDKRERAAALVESLWRLSQRAENEGVRLAAIKEIIDRIDGKSVERKEIRNLKIEGVVYLPPTDTEMKNITEE